MPRLVDIQSYWFTYDADNRVVISDGALVNGAVMLTKAATSYTQGYDAAGNATMRTTIDAASGATMAQASYYDARNELVRADYSVNLANGASRGIEEARQYDAAGHQVASEQF